MKKRLAKIISLTCAASLTLALTACSSSSPETPSAPAEQETEAPAEQGAETPASDTSFPEDTVNIICHAKEGGGSDALARQVAQVLQDQQGWSVTVENKTGGSGSVGMQFVQNSKPDGYTIGTAPVELSMIEALGYAELNPENVSLLGCGMSWPAALYVPEDAPYDTLEDFVNYCKENPGKVQVANSGIGSIWHIGACVLADKADIEITHVPYDGATGAMTALLGKEIDAAVVGTCEGFSYVESGDLKCLASFSEERSSVLPDSPTAAEQGYDANVICWVGFLAPQGVDEASLTILQDALKATFENEDYIAFCEGRGCDSTYFSPEEFYEMAAADYTYYSQLISDLGIVVE